MLRNKGCVIAFVVLVVLSILFFFLLDLYTDLAWLETLGVASILWREISSRLLLLAGGWIVAALFLGVSWWLARALAGGDRMTAVSYTHLTLPTIIFPCRSRWGAGR